MEARIWYPWHTFDSKSYCLSAWPGGPWPIQAPGLLYGKQEQEYLPGLPLSVAIEIEQQNCIVNCKTLATFKVWTSTFVWHSLWTIWCSYSATKGQCVVSSYINQIWTVLWVFTSHTTFNLLECFLNNFTLAKYLSELLSFYGGMCFTLNLAWNYE